MNEQIPPPSETFANAVRIAQTTDKAELFRSLRFNTLIGNGTILPQRRTQDFPAIDDTYLKSLENDPYRYANLVMFNEFITEMTTIDQDQPRNINEALSRLKFDDNPFDESGNLETQRHNLETILMIRFGLNPESMTDRVEMTTHMWHALNVAKKNINALRETIVEATGNVVFMDTSEMMDEIKTAQHVDDLLRWAFHPKATTRMREEGMRQFVLAVESTGSMLVHKRRANGTVGKVLRFFDLYVWDQTKPIGYLREEALFALYDINTNTCLQVSGDLNDLSPKPGQEIRYRHNPQRVTYDEEGILEVRLGGRDKEEESAGRKIIIDNGGALDDYSGIMAYVKNPEDAIRLLKVWNKAFKDHQIRMEINPLDGFSNDFTEPFSYEPYARDEYDSPTIKLNSNCTGTNNPDRGLNRDVIQGDILLYFYDKKKKKWTAKKIEFQIKSFAQAYRDEDSGTSAHTLYQEKKQSRLIADGSDSYRSLNFPDAYLLDIQQPAINNGHVQRDPLTTVNDGELYQQIKESRIRRLKGRRKITIDKE